MGHKKDKTDVENSQHKSGLISKISHNPLAIAIIGVLLNFAITAFSFYVLLPTKIEYIENEISTLNNNYEELDDKIDDLIVLDSKVEILNDDIKRIEDFIDKNSTLQINPTFIPNLQCSTNNGIFLLSSPGWKSTDIIATDDLSGKEFTASELVNQKLLFPYIGDNDEEVYFYGQYNENNHWDETCIINIYKNNTLILITEATYDDGNLLNYKQAIPSEDDVNGWIISERANQGNLNIGDSWKYMSEKDYIKDFTFETVTATDIFSVKSFNATLNAKLKEYYHGNTSDGYYNDDTGEAYFVSYMDNGTVKTLYVGNFKDGHFNDDTGNAWYITREENTTYMYFKGSFKDGIAQHNSTSIFENNLTLARIQELINGKSYNCDLNWFDTNSSKPA